MSTDKKQIAIFGGSFDPPHLGHVLCACYAYSQAGVDEVWVIPVATHPYAKKLSPWENRCALCTAAFSEYPFIQLRNDEQKNTSGRTFDLITTLKDKNPNCEFSLIGGTDIQNDIHNWYRGEELAQLVRLIGVPRNAETELSESTDPLALPAISSSLIRKLAADKSKRAIISQYLPHAVYEIILEKNLYR